MTGRRINEGTISGIPNNVRFGASMRLYECKTTGRQYKSVFAIRDVYPYEELLAHYGDQVTWTYPDEPAESGEHGKDNPDPENGNQNGNGFEKQRGKEEKKEEPMSPNLRVRTLTQLPEPTTLLLLKMQILMQMLRQLLTQRNQRQRQKNQMQMQWELAATKRLVNCTPSDLSIVTAMLASQ